MLYSTGAIEPVEKEECDSEVYYYRFLLSNIEENIITHRWALSAIPFEMPIVPAGYSSKGPEYISGCFSRDAIFGAESGEPMKVDCLVKMDIQTLIRRGMNEDIESIEGCVDKRIYKR